jgi:hypothetical protein
MESKSNRSFTGMLVLLLVLFIGQVISYFTAPDSWRSFMATLPKIISMITFWGPIIAIISYAFVEIALRLLGFKSLQDLRRESVEENNPAPAIIFVGMLIASILFLMILIKP